jgi:Sulfatase
MKWSGRVSVAFATIATLLGVTGAPASRAQEKKPNILVIMGDDIGISNIGAYGRGLMAGRTPNLDKLAKEGMLSPTITPRRVARRVARTSSWVDCRSARE